MTHHEKATLDGRARSLVLDENEHTNKDEKSSDDELFFYIAGQFFESRSQIYESMLQKRRNILTVMSFCLVGEITYMSSLQTPTESFSAACLLVAMFSWLIAFTLTIWVALRAKEIALFPGGEEGLSFLVNNADIAELSNRLKATSILKQNGVRGFWKAWSNRFTTASTTLIDIYLKRTGFIYPNRYASSHKDLAGMYRSKVNPLDDLKGFNKNAWLGSQARAFATSLVIARSTRKKFGVIYGLFIVNILFFLLSATQLLWGYL